MSFSSFLMADVVSCAACKILLGRASFAGVWLLDSDAFISRGYTRDIDLRAVA